ncbi:unnamed protein product [Ixodes hexagonus]
MTLKARIENGVVYSPYASEPVPETSLYQAVKQLLEQHRNRTAVVWDDEDVTFPELLRMFQRYAAGFQAHGIKKGDRVLVHLNNSLENMVALYSIVFAGGVAVSSDPFLSDEDILYRIRDSNAVYILTAASEADRFNNMRGKLNMKGYFTVGTAPGFVSVTEFRKLKEDTYLECQVEDVNSEVVVMFYTSGTTGIPKGAEHTHFSIVASLPRPKSYNDFNDEEVICSRFNITSSPGFRLYLRVFSSGAKTILLPTSAGPRKVLDALTKCKVTSILGSITMIEQLARKIEVEGIHLDCLKSVIITGARVGHTTLRQLEPAFGSALIKSCYGSTEIGRISQPPMGEFKWYGIGFPAPMAEIKVVDVKSGKVLGPNEQGEVLVKSQTSMKGYYGNPEATSKVITPDGWLRTGSDICYYNEDGQFFFVERMNQLFRCMGTHVAPCQIESVLLRHQGIAEAAVIGVPHAEYQEAARAFVVLKTSSSKVTKEELQDFVAGK